MPALSESSSLDALRQLAQTDFESFKRYFNALLPHKAAGLFSPLGRSPHELAQALRATSASLEDLGIQSKTTVTGVIGIDGIRFEMKEPLSVYTSEWLQIITDMNSAEIEDAMVILQAVDRSLADEGYPPDDWTILLVDILSKPPTWRERAINTIPRCFGAHPAGVDDLAAHIPLESNGLLPLNAFQVFAGLTQRSDRDDYPSTLDTLNALKRVGVTDSVNPETGGSCLHIAAVSQPAASLQAFVEVFPQSVNAKQWNGQRPLDLAATSHHRNVKVLLGGGADPKPVDCLNETALDYAVACRDYEAAMILLATLAFDDKDVERALSMSNEFAVAKDQDQFSRLRAFHAAAMAQKSMGSIASIKESLTSL